MGDIVRKKLAELKVYMPNTLVTALIIAKSEPEPILPAESNEYSSDMICFMLRDSTYDIANCKFWGSREEVEDHNLRLQIGAVIDVINARVLPLEQQHFHPLCTSPYTLVIKDNYGMLNKHDYHDMHIIKKMEKLLWTPHKPIENAQRLADAESIVFTSPCDGIFVDLLVAIVAIHPVTQILSERSGRMLNCLEAVVVDQSHMQGNILAICNSAWITRAQHHWLAAKTILYLIDVKIVYSAFHNCNILSFTKRTLVYENPLGQAAFDLAELITGVPRWKYTFFAAIRNGGYLSNPGGIATQMTAKDVYARAKDNRTYDSSHFTALLLATVTKLYIGAEGIGKKCAACQRAYASMGDAAVEACQSSGSGHQWRAFFNFNIHLADDTGILLQSRIRNEIAERILGVNAAKFSKMNEKQKDSLIWRFFFCPFKVKLHVKKTSPVSIAVLDMKPTIS